MSQTEFAPYLEEYLTSCILRQKYNRENLTALMLDRFIDTPNEQDLPVKLINLCCKVPVHFNEKLDERLSILGISKRQFLELAMHHALNMTDDLIAHYRLIETLQGE